jgi:hypothetical protein
MAHDAGDGRYGQDWGEQVTLQASSEAQGSRETAASLPPLSVAGALKSNLQQDAAAPGAGVREGGSSRLSKDAHAPPMPATSNMAALQARCSPPCVRECCPAMFASPAPLCTHVCMHTYWDVGLTWHGQRSARELELQLADKTSGNDNEQRSGQEVGDGRTQTTGPHSGPDSALRGPHLGQPEPHARQVVEHEQEMRRKTYEYMSDDDSDDYDDLLFPPVRGWGQGGAAAGEGASKIAVLEDVM